MPDLCLNFLLIPPHAIQPVIIPSPTNSYPLILGGTPALDIWELDTISRITMHSSVCSPPTDLTGLIRTVVPVPHLISIFLRMFPWPASASSVPLDGSELFLPCWIRVHAETVLFVIFSYVMFLLFLLFSNCKSMLMNNRFKLNYIWWSVIIDMTLLIHPCTGGGGLFNVTAPWTRNWSSLVALQVDVVFYTPVSMTNYCLTINDMIYTLCYPWGPDCNFITSPYRHGYAQNSNLERPRPR